MPPAGLRVKATPVAEVSPLLPKSHGLDVDGGAELVGDAVLLAVNAGALVHPAAKDGLDGKAKLELRIVRKDGLTIGDLELGVQGGPRRWRRRCP